MVVTSIWSLTTRNAEVTRNRSRVKSRTSVILKLFEAIIVKLLKGYPVSFGFLIERTL